MNSYTNSKNQTIYFSDVTLFSVEVGRDNPIKSRRKEQRAIISLGGEEITLMGGEFDEFNRGFSDWRGNGSPKHVEDLGAVGE